jgi:DNA-binding protein
MAQEKVNDNIVFIGGKPFMNYVTGVVMQFTTNNASEVTIKARGKFISKAVDVAEVARKRFLKDQNISIKEIKIDSEEFENKEGKKVNVSTLDIVLSK